MAKYKKIEIKERDLEVLVRLFPENIEEGLKYVYLQQYTDIVPLDVLLVDSDNSLVNCVLKIVEDDNMLMQGLNNYDYLTKNIKEFLRTHKSKGIKINTTQEPRLFLIAPSFSIALQNRCKWIDIPVSLYTYQCIAIDTNPEDLIPIYKKIQIPSKPEIVSVPTIDQRLKYIKVSAVRKNVEKLIGILKKWDEDKIIVEAIKFDISLKISGRVFAYITPRKKNYLIFTHDIDGTWKRYKIDNQEELDKALQVVRLNFDKLKNNHYHKNGRLISHGNMLKKARHE